MRKQNKNIILIILLILLCLSIVLSVSTGSYEISFKDSVKAMFIDDGSIARILIWNLRLPRTLCALLVGMGLALAGCLLQGVMRNNLASPSTIGVTSGASFVGYIVLVVFPAYAYLLPIGTILGSFLTTMLIYALAYQKGVSPVKMILSGLAVSAMFGAFNDIIKIFFAEDLGNASAFLVGGFNSLGWSDFRLILPYSVIGITLCMFLPQKLNILVLGDETANSLGLKTERFRLLLIIIASLLAGSCIAIAGLISFVGLIVPHISRLIIGSDHRYLLPASCLIGAILVVVCDTIGRVILEVGEVPASIIISLIGAPFFLYLLKTRHKER